MPQQAQKSASLCSVKCLVLHIHFANLLPFSGVLISSLKKFAFDTVLLCSLGCLGTMASLLHKCPPSDGIINYHDQLGGLVLFCFFETESHTAAQGGLEPTLGFLLLFS